MSNSSFSQFSNAPTYRRLYDAIETEITRGRLKPGAKLPTEMSLAEQFGVNRSTVREAIRLREQTGLVQRKSSRRLEVSYPDTGHLAAGIGRALQMHGLSFMELWYALITIEPALAELAAVHITDEQLAALEENLAETRKVVNNARQMAELDVRFHAMVAQASGNRVLQLAREPINPMFQYCIARVAGQLSQAATRNIEANEAILNALRAHDPGEARQWMFRHITDFRRGYEHAGFDLNAPIEMRR